MTQLPNVLAWEVDGKWFYTESEVLAASTAEVVQRYESDDRILLYRPAGASGLLIWDAELVDWR